MEGYIRSVIYDEIGKYIAERREIVSDSILDGGIREIGDYRERCGYLRCLRDFEDFIGSLRRDGER